MQKSIDGPYDIFQVAKDILDRYQGIIATEGSSPCGSSLETQSQILVEQWTNHGSPLEFGAEWLTKSLLTTGVELKDKVENISQAILQYVTPAKQPVDIGGANIDLSLPEIRRLIHHLEQKSLIKSRGQTDKTCESEELQQKRSLAAWLDKAGELQIQAAEDYNLWASEKQRLENGCKKNIQEILLCLSSLHRWSSQAWNDKTQRDEAFRELEAQLECMKEAVADLKSQLHEAENNFHESRVQHENAEKQHTRDKQDLEAANKRLVELIGEYDQRAETTALETEAAQEEIKILKKANEDILAMDFGLSDIVTAFLQSKALDTVNARAAENLGSSPGTEPAYRDARSLKTQELFEALASVLKSSAERDLRILYQSMRNLSSTAPYLLSDVDYGITPAESLQLEREWNQKKNARLMLRLLDDVSTPDSSTGESAVTEDLEQETDENRRIIELEKQVAYQEAIIQHMNMAIQASIEVWKALEERVEVVTGCIEHLYERDQKEGQRRCFSLPIGRSINSSSNQVLAVLCFITIIAFLLATIAEGWKFGAWKEANEIGRALYVEGRSYWCAAPPDFRFLLTWAQSMHLTSGWGLVDS